MLRATASRWLHRLRTLAALMVTLFIGGATPVALLAPAPAHAQTCSVNKTGTCQLFQVASVSLSTTEATAVTTTDPSEAKTGHQSQSVCDITAPYPVYCGNGIQSPPSNGTATDDLSNGGLVTYTPNPGFVGTDSFVTQTGLLTDGLTRAWVITTTYTVTVTGVANPAPTVSNASISTAYDTPGSVALPSSGAVTSFSIASAPANGAAAISGSTAVYTPNSGFAGSDSFTFYATGPGGTSNIATVSVTVAPPPAPVVSNAVVFTPYGVPAILTLSGSGVISAYAIGTSPGHGQVTLSGSTATYTPTPGFTGSDSFTFQATGPGGTSNTATVTVNVAPIAVSGAGSTPENTPTPVYLSYSGEVTSFAITSNPSHGAISLSGSVATYSPAAGFVGQDSFEFEVSGPTGTSTPATITINVQSPAPTLANASISTAYDTPGSTALASTGTVTSFTIASAPAHGAATISGSTAVYTPNAGYYGSDSFTFHVTGPGGTSAPATVSVTVQAPPAPVASNGALSVAYDAPGSVTLPASGVVSSYAIVAAPSHGSVTLSGAVATFTPSSGYIGTDSFTFDVTGPGGTSGVATIAVTIEPPPAPVANAGSLTCPYQTTCTTTLTSTGIGSTYALATQGSNGTCSISGSTLTYTPAWGAVGADSCTFTVTGPGGVSAPATISITNEPPALPNPGGSTGTPIPTSGASVAICAAGQTASIPGLPGPPTGTVYDPNWCDEQALTIAQQALQLANQQSQLTALQNQLAAQQKMVQGLGSDSTSATLASVNAKAQAILQQASGIGFNAQTAGSSFAAAYPGGTTVAGFNGSQLTAAMQAWQANAAQALQTSVAVQAQIAGSQAGVASSIQGAVNASNAAVGPTAAHQATNQILAAVSTQLAQLQDILLAESQAYAALAAAKAQAAGAAAASTAQTQGQVSKPLTAPPGVTDTTHM